MGGPASAFAAFAVAGIVLAAMFLGLSVVIGSVQEKSLERIKARSRDVKKWGGWILIVIGSWFVVLAIWADFFATIFPV